MSKKNRRKSLVQKETLLPQSEFSVDDSKIYLILAIVVFHVLPLIFMAFGERGKLMYDMTYMTINTMFLAIAGIIYGIRKGFNLKLPLIMAALGALSLIFYAEFSAEMAITGRLVFIITYLIIAGGGVALGAFIKKLFRL